MLLILAVGCASPPPAREPDHARLIRELERLTIELERGRNELERVAVELRELIEDFREQPRVEWIQLAADPPSGRRLLRDPRLIAEVERILRFESDGAHFIEGIERGDLELRESVEDFHEQAPINRMPMLFEDDIPAWRRNLGRE